MICAGTGLAPFRGLIQERARYLRNNPGKETDLGSAVLFFGCRGENLDDLYRDELDEFEKQGAVTVRRAYSQDPTAASQGCKYVTDKVRAHIDEIEGLWKQGGRIYVCGMKKMADDVYNLISPRLFRADQLAKRTEEDSVDAWHKKLPRGQYVVEIFG